MSNASIAVLPALTDVSSFDETLSALVVAAAKADKATATVADKATAHGPFALAAMYDSGEIERMSIDAWIAKACDAAGVKSRKGKRNAQALRDGGYTGLYNLAVDLKWIDDNASDVPAIVDCIDEFCQWDRDGSMRRNYLIAGKHMLPAIAMLSSVEDVIDAYDAIDDVEGKDVDKAGYYKAISAPTSWAALMTAARQAYKDAQPETDTIGKKLEAATKLLSEFALVDVKAYGEAIVSLQNAINSCTALLVAEVEANEAAARKSA